MCLWTQRPPLIANSNDDQAGSQGHISLITVERSCPKMFFCNMKALIYISFSSYDQCKFKKRAKC